MENELKHYGVKGMKWGIRRYQDKYGKLTPEGRKRAKMEYKEDNQKAFELGKNAVLAERALNYADKMVKKAKKKNDTVAVTRAKKARKILEKEYKKSIKEVTAHAQSLMKKYGDEAVKPIKYDTKTGHLKEETLKPSTRALVRTLRFLSAAPTTSVELALKYRNDKNKYEQTFNKANMK